MQRLFYIYLMYRHNLFFFLSGGQSAFNKGKIKIEKYEYPDFIYILSTKWFIWWIPMKSFKIWRKDKLLKKLKIWHNKQQ